MNAKAKEVVEEGLESPTLTLVLQNVGLVIGFLIMFLLSAFGGDFQL